MPDLPLDLFDDDASLYGGIPARPERTSPGLEPTRRRPPVDDEVVSVTTIAEVGATPAPERRGPSAWPERPARVEPARISEGDRR